MQIRKANQKGVLLIKLDIFEDFRGEYVETYNEELYRKNGIDMKFVQDDISVSTKNVLRGIHGDSETWNWCVKNQDEHLNKKNYFMKENIK